MEHNQAQILFLRDLAILEDLEREMIAILHLDPPQLEVLRRPSAGQMILPIDQKDTTYIQKYACDPCCFLHWRSFPSAHAKMYSAGF